MTSAPAVRRGSQQPRISSVPPHLTTAGPDASEYAESVGLVLDPWQRLVLDGAMAENGALWAAFEVGLVVPRQNGKGGVLEARELAGIELFGERLIIHTAHELKTAEDARRRMEQLCEASPDLGRQVKRVVRTNGKEAIEFKNGARIKYLARSKGSGRGFTEGGLVVMDEAMFLSAESMDALLPTLSASPNPQVWYTGSAGLAESTQLLGIRNRALAGGDPSLAYFEWSVEDEGDLDDPDQWALANPALGIRISEKYIVKERAALTEEGFARERAGKWEGGNLRTVIDLAVWKTLHDPHPPNVTGPAFAIDVNPDRSRSSPAFAGNRPDGKRHVEVILNDRGTSWVVDALIQLTIEHPGAVVVLDTTGPAGSLLKDIEDAGIVPLVVSAREMAQACGAFYDACVDKANLTHFDQPALNSALGAARKRPLGDAWAWHRRDSTDISPLVAVTLALFGLAHPPPPKKQRSGIVQGIR